MKSQFCVQDIVERYNNGEEINHIAGSIGSNYRSIWQIFKRKGVLKNRGNRRLRLNAGNKFGKLTIIGYEGLSKKGPSKTYWKVKCECGTEKVVLGSSLSSGAAQSCGCNVGFKRGSLHKLWSGCGKISGSQWCKLQDSARSRGHEVKITKEEAWNLYEKQNGKCALSGVDIGFAQDSESHSHGNTTASLDRIDSKKGYTLSNIQWTHKMVNRMKWGLTVSQFVGFCKAVAKHSQSDWFWEPSTRWK